MAARVRRDGEERVPRRRRVRVRGAVRRGGVRASRDGNREAPQAGRPYVVTLQYGRT